MAPRGLSLKRAPLGSPTDGLPCLQRWAAACRNSLPLMLCPRVRRGASSPAMPSSCGLLAVGCLERWNHPDSGFPLGGRTSGLCLNFPSVKRGDGAPWGLPWAVGNRPVCPSVLPH